jgi:hypothetical protein
MKIDKLFIILALDVFKMRLNRLNGRTSTLEPMMNIDII